LDFFDLRPLFDTYYSREKTVSSLRVKKPSSYHVERALADLDDESTLYVGDSESDVIAAHACGNRFGVRSPATLWEGTPISRWSRPTRCTPCTRWHS